MVSFEGALASSAPAPTKNKGATLAKSNSKASSVAKLPKKQAKAKPTANKDQNKTTAGSIKAINGVSQKPWYKKGDVEVKSTLSPAATGVKTPWYKDPAIVPSGTSSSDATVKETPWYKGQTPNTPTSGPQSTQSTAPWYKQQDSSKAAKSLEKPWYKIEDESITFDESLYAEAQSLGPTSSGVDGGNIQSAPQKLEEGEIELNLAPPSEEDALNVDEEISESEAAEGINTDESTLELGDLPEEEAVTEESLNLEPMAEGSEDLEELNLEDVSETSDLEETESSSTAEDSSEDGTLELDPLSEESEASLDLEPLAEESDPELNLEPLDEESGKSQDPEKKDTAGDVLKGLGSIKGTEDVFSFATNLLGNLGKDKSEGEGSESSAPRPTRATPPKQAAPKTKVLAPQPEDEPELKLDDVEAEEKTPAPKSSAFRTSSRLDDLKSRIKKVGDKEVITTAGGQNVVLMADGTLVIKPGS